MTLSQKYKRTYVGHKKGTVTMFHHQGQPNSVELGYDSVKGPFKTTLGAGYYMKHVDANPGVELTVNAAERKAAQEALREMLPIKNTPPSPVF